MLDEVDATTTRQHPVKQDEIRKRLSQLTHRRIIIFSLNRLIALLFKHETQHFTNRCFVFNNQNPSRHN
ncbi:Uncharacterised protein [Vibrio cholerae]|nr:Uncharacterised protein [Vibrio cholerae]CSC98737.1 Uncharacterised protein [Vibrio cholerae]